MPPASQDHDSLPANQASTTGIEVDDPLVVVVTLDLSTELMERISSVDPRVRPVLALSGEQGPSLPAEQLDEALSQAEVFFGFRFPLEWFTRAPRVRWLQLSSAGVDTFVRTGILQQRPDLIVTTASGIHEVPISEHILGMMLHFSRGFDVAVRNQAAHNWSRLSPDELYQKTVCFVGYGPIARRAATLCTAFGMRVLCVRASINAPQPGEGPVERFYPVSELNEALGESDFVVVAAPHTPASAGMIGRGQFEAMKPGAVLVNISRGALVDERAMIEALQSGKLKGAGLDVFVQEPLPETSPLWDMPNVLITAHSSGANPHYDERAIALFCDNLARYLRGEPLHNHVDFERGY